MKFKQKFWLYQRTKKEWNMLTVREAADSTRRRFYGKEAGGWEHEGRPSGFFLDPNETLTIELDLSWDDKAGTERPQGTCVETLFFGPWNYELRNPQATAHKPSATQVLDAARKNPNAPFGVVEIWVNGQHFDTHVLSVGRASLISDLGGLGDRPIWGHNVIEYKFTSAFAVFVKSFEIYSANPIA